MIESVAYDSVRINLVQLWRSSGDTIINSLVCNAFTRGDEYLLQFILGCSVLPSVIRTVQMYSTKNLEKLFYLTRTWCFYTLSKNEELRKMELPVIALSTLLYVNHKWL